MSDQGFTFSRRSEVFITVSAFACTKELLIHDLAQMNSSWCALWFEFLTHFSLETPKRVIGKQGRPRSDATESGFLLFAKFDLFSLGISKSQSLTNLKLKLEYSSI